MTFKKELYPNLYLTKVEEIKINFLIKYKIKAIILDVDNTLINYYKQLSEDVIKWCKDLQGQGIKMYILSNTNKREKSRNGCK